MSPNNYKRYRNQALVGYAILAIGVGFAVQEAREAAHSAQRAARTNAAVLAESVRRGEKVRAVICDGIKEDELNSVKSLNSPLVKKFKEFSHEDLIKATKETLETDKKRRMTVGPSDPVAACLFSAVPPDKVK